MGIRSALLCALFLLISAPVSAASNLADLAPADEYFGHMKMSVLGIANAIKDAGLHLDRGDNPEAIVSGLSWTEDAIRDWEKHFPRDPWIPKSLINLRHVYERVTSPHGLDALNRIGGWMERDFPAPPSAEAAK